MVSFGLMLVVLLSCACCARATAALMSGAGVVTPTPDLWGLAVASARPSKLRRRPPEPPLVILLSRPVRPDVVTTTPDVDDGDAHGPKLWCLRILAYQAS